MMRNIVMKLAYDGTDYFGWQIQPSLRTIQGTLEEKISQIVGHPAKVVGAGRTDAGVHAIGQVANFKTDTNIPLNSLKKGINSLLPEDIRVLDVWEAPLDFHARYKAKSKVYIYFMESGDVVSPFFCRYVFHVRRKLFWKDMERASKFLLGTHDFSSFSSFGGSCERTIYKVGFYQKGTLFTFFIEGNGFLRYMVRRIIGTLLYVGSGKITVEEFREIVEVKDRTKAGPTAPANGLFLLSVKY